MKKKIRIIFLFLLVVAGVFMFVYGEIDDSPGGQLLGLITTFFSIISLIRIKRKNFSGPDFLE